MKTTATLLLFGILIAFSQTATRAGTVMATSELVTRITGVRCALAALVLLMTIAVRAELPVSGRPVPELAALDTIMTEFMNDPSRMIPAGVLGISRGGRVVFLRAYGELR